MNCGWNRHCIGINSRLNLFQSFKLIDSTFLNVLFDIIFFWGCCRYNWKGFTGSIFYFWKILPLLVPTVGKENWTCHGTVAIWSSGCEWPSGLTPFPRHFSILQFYNKEPWYQAAICLLFLPPLHVISKGMQQVYCLFIPC